MFINEKKYLLLHDEYIPFLFMKKKLLLFILAPLFAITQGAWAVETPQAIWCRGNTTLYFINSETEYAAADTYDGQFVNQVWSGTDVTATPTNGKPQFNKAVYEYCTRVVFDESFASVRPTSCTNWFDLCYQLTTIEGLENLNTSEVTNMKRMFGRCRKLTSLDLSSFNTAMVTDMNSMFMSCTGLTSLDLSNFNTADVHDMQSMFYECEQLTYLDLSSFNTANVTDMYWMFRYCRNLKTIYVSDEWTVDNVTESLNMFAGCTKPLKGGQGTEYNDSNPNDKSYAHIDGGTSYPGYLTLKVYEIAIDETSSDNSNIISKYNGKPCNVTLARTIVPNTYNTLSLPFDVDNDVLKATFGDGVELAQLNGTRMENETLYFDFTRAEAITAGVPYLIYVSNAVESPITFDNVTVKEGTQPVTTDLAKFIPVFDVTTLQNGNENILFLGANNTLLYPSTNSGAMKGFRAYFEVTGEAKGARAMVKIDNSQTGVKTILSENLQNQQVYDLQGRSVSHPTKGLYIVNGKKVIIK